MTPTHMPVLTVAPNGARHGRADHEALPLTLPEIVETARACADAGAEAIHIHLRDADGQHILDAGRYHVAIEAVERVTAGAMLVQAATEVAAPAYTALILRRTIVEHILYSSDELDRLGDLVRRGVIPDENLDLLFVLGSYGSDHTDPVDPVG